MCNHRRKNPERCDAILSCISFSLRPEPDQSEERCGKSGVLKLPVHVFIINTINNMEDAIRATARRLEPNLRAWRYWKIRSRNNSTTLVQDISLPLSLSLTVSLPLSLRLAVFDNILKPVSEEADALYTGGSVHPATRELMSPI